jgi:hypothetical protein
MSPMTDYPMPPPRQRGGGPPVPPPPLGVDYGDGELIPPLPNNPYAGQAPAPPVPGANAGGGPGAPLPEAGPGVFGGMFNAGMQVGRPVLNDTSSPMPPMPPPLNAPQEPPRYLQAQPNPMPGPDAQYGQGPGPMAPGRRFPRATSLIPSGPPMRQGY